VLKITII